MVVRGAGPADPAVNKVTCSTCCDDMMYNTGHGVCNCVNQHWASWNDTGKLCRGQGHTMILPAIVSLHTHTMCIKWEAQK